MKIIDAYWEKRNLGKNTCEVIFTNEDTLDSFVKNEEYFEKFEYIVVKVPINKPSIVEYIQNAGYKFIESAVIMLKDMDEFVVPERYEKLYSMCRVEPMEQIDISIMYEQIRKGIFRTDRIVLDKHFTDIIARQRYVYWLKDMIKAGETSYKVMFQQKTIGFFLFSKNDQNEYHGILGGVYDGFEKIGLGMLVAIAEAEYIKKLNGKLYYAHFSSNNLPNIRLHEKLGFVIESMTNVFVKHNFNF